MPNPYPTALRERAVRAYEHGTDTYGDVVAQFSISGHADSLGPTRARDRLGRLLAKRGGWRSPVDVAHLHSIVHERPDRTTDELVESTTGAVAVGGWG